MTEIMRPLLQGGLVALVAVLGSSSMALATAQTSWNNVSVSCSNGTYQYVTSNVQHQLFGDVQVRQTAAADPVVGLYHLQSAQGNNTSAKAAPTGTTVMWTNVIASTYKVWHTANISVNCNGSLPGYGNTLVSGWARYDF